MPYERDPARMIGPLGSRCCCVAQSAGLFRLKKEYGVDPVPGLLAVARANEIDFDVENEPDSFLLNSRTSSCTIERHSRIWAHCCYGSYGSCALSRRVA